jgi:hypothetical protein
MSMTSDLRWIRRLLAAIVVLLVVIIFKLSALTGPLQSRAVAQIPDSGLQRMQLLDGQRKIHRSIEALLQHLRTQVIKVKVVGTDKDSEASSQRKRSAPKK